MSGKLFIHPHHVYFLLLTLATPKVWLSGCTATGSDVYIRSLCMSADIIIVTQYYVHTSLCTVCDMLCNNCVRHKTHCGKKKLTDVFRWLNVSVRVVLCGWVNEHAHTHTPHVSQAGWLVCFCMRLLSCSCVTGSGVLVRGTWRPSQI